MDLSKIYTELIMEHSRSGRNRRVLEEMDREERGHNPNCGDDITLQIKFAGDRISDLAFTGSGCAISQASTSIMIDLIKGKEKEEALELIEIFLRMIKGEELTEEEQERLGDALVLKNISYMPARVKCAVLAWHTLKEVIDA